LKLGISKSLDCLFSYINYKVSNKTQDINDNFELWIKDRFGPRLFEIFFKEYSEKLWGIPCNQLDSEFAIQRIKKFSLTEAIKSSLSITKRSHHKTLVDQFAYPMGGTGMIYERMMKYIEKNGGRVFTNSPINKVIIKNNIATGIELNNGEFKEYNKVVSSMPITNLINTMPMVPLEIINKSKLLKFRNTILVYLKIKDNNLFPDNWIYIHDPKIGAGRLTNFRNWVPELYGDQHESILCLEYWCNQGDKIWNHNDEQLISLAINDLLKTGLTNESRIDDGYVYRINKCYPVYSKGYKKILSPIQDFLNDINNLFVIGRYGSFKYNNQDHSILMGLLTAENIIDNANHDLWGINNDYEYQESSSITIKES